MNAGNEYIELLDIAIYKEVASEALYVALKGRTTDTGAAGLMQDLANEEKKHVQWLTDFKEKGTKTGWHRRKVTDLKISEYLSSPDNLEGAGLQDTLIFAIKREQSSIDFYSRMTGTLQTRSGKALCRKLANEEIRHKIKLELLYDDVFLGED